MFMFVNFKDTKKVDHILESSLHSLLNATISSVSLLQNHQKLSWGRLDFQSFFCFTFCQLSVIGNQGDIHVVSKFLCLLRHPVKQRLLLTLSLLGYLKTRICWGGVNLPPPLPLNPMFDVQIWQMIHHWKALVPYF